MHVKRRASEFTSCCPEAIRWMESIHVYTQHLNFEQLLSTILRIWSLQERGLEFAGMLQLCTNQTIRQKKVLPNFLNVILTAFLKMLSHRSSIYGKYAQNNLVKQLRQRIKFNSHPFPRTGFSFNQSAFKLLHFPSSSIVLSGSCSLFPQRLIATRFQCHTEKKKNKQQQGSIKNSSY